VETRYLDVEDLLHIIELEDLGPVRDLGLLDSATARPSSSAFGVDAYPSLEEKAAALLDSIVGNHALTDGNKRLGWLATAAFLWINGHVLLAPENDAYDLVIGIAERRLSIAETAAALASWTTLRNPSS
jgi:death on curing protein